WSGPPLCRTDWQSVLGSFPDGLPIRPTVADRRSNETSDDERRRCQALLGDTDCPPDCGDRCAGAVLPEHHHLGRDPHAGDRLRNAHSVRSATLPAVGPEDLPTARNTAGRPTRRSGGGRVTLVDIPAPRAFLWCVALTVRMCAWPANEGTGSASLSPSQDHRHEPSQSS